MNCPKTHQRRLNIDLFGLLSSRFLYRGVESHRIPDDKVIQAEKESEKRTKERQAEFKTNVDSYNEFYAKEPDSKSATDKTHYEALTLNFSDLSGIEKQVNTIMGTLREREGKNWKAALATDDQYALLSDMLQVIEEMKRLPKKQEETIEYAHRSRLAERHTRMIKASEAQELWKKNKAYGELSGVFESLAGTREFIGTWQGPDGLASPDQREAKELFFAIMAEKTNGFKENFVLGDGTVFGNDPDENIKNFPFIYNEFLKREGTVHKYHVSLESIAAASAAASEATKKVASLDKVEDIVAANAGAGITVGELGPTPGMPDTKGWIERKAVLGGMVYKLEQKAAENPDLPQAPGWRKASQALAAYRDHADAQLHLSSLKDREQAVKKNFTRIELSQPERRKMVMELAMRQFMQARAIVDRPFGNANWQGLLHPTVRRMMIGSVYETGVATYETDAKGIVSYNENIRDQNVWMMSALAGSDYFNFKEVGENMDANHTALLKAAYLGSRVAVLLEQTKETRNLLNAWIQVLDAAPTFSSMSPDDKEKFFKEKMGPYPPAYVKKYVKYTLPEAQEALKTLDADRTRLGNFLQETADAIKAPYSDQSKKFIEDMTSGRYAGKLAPEIGHIGDLGVISGASLKAYEKAMYDLQINFKTAELEDKNSLMFFEGLGMHIEGIEPKYLSEIKKNPRLKTEYWEALLLGSDEEFAQLKNLFDVIIPDDSGGGKQDFITGLTTLHKKYRGDKNFIHTQENLAEGSDDGIVLNVFRMLKIHLTGRAEKAAGSNLKQKEIEAKLGGMHIGDKVTKYVSGVWDMLTGPGQSMANRAAGLVLMYGFYKSTRMAMKGEGAAGKALRALYVAGAVEIAVKQITGRGLLDRTGLDSVTGAMEGTYEAVLLQNGKKEMEKKEISPEAHAAALYELNNVPFNDIMAWYESSDPNGMPRTKGSRDLLPKKVNLRKIGERVTWKEQNRDMEARRVVYETVKHFFGYVGAKNNHQGAEDGKEALKERWVTMIDHPDYKPQYTPYTHKEWLKAGGVQKRDVTWQMVMRAEIDPREVELTLNKTPVGQIQETATEWATSLSEWVREYAYNPGSGYAEIFFENCGEKAQDVKAFLGETYEWTKRKAYFGKEKVILWYGEHQYEIRRTVENHWQLLVTGVKLPFQVIYGVDNFAIPWTVAKLKQIEESLKNNQTVEVTHALTASEIASNPATMGFPNVEVNPQFKFYGIHQENFMKAFNKKGEWFHEDNGSHVGYFISKMTPKEAGINMADPTYASNPANVISKMTEASRKQAMEAYRRQGMSYAEIEKYMYSIHTVNKTTDPQTTYIFWRMPLKGSAELYMKESGKWADFMDPNKYKDREAFEVDPSQTTWENLRRAFALDLGPTRTLVSGAGAIVAQIPRASFGVVKVGGDILKGINHLINEDRNRRGGRGGPNQPKDGFDTTVDLITQRTPGQQQWIDEVFTSAGSEHTALSDYYKNSANAKLFDFSLQFAQKNSGGVPLFLGIMEGRPGYEGSAYLKTSRNPEKTYADMWKFYRREWKGKKPDADIEAALTAKLPEPPPTP